MSLLKEKLLNDSIQTIRRLWKGEGRNLYKKLIGKELSQWMDTQLGTSKPWKKSTEKGEDDPLLRVALQSRVILLLVSDLDHLSDIEYDNAVTSMMPLTENKDLRAILSVFKEFNLAQLERLGAIKFFDAMHTIHAELNNLPEKAARLCAAPS